jgi:uncharacterized protein (TIGR04255 family)
MPAEPITNLSNKPLVEVIFELRWGLEGPPGIAVDPYYQMLIGQFYSAVKADYSFWERLPTAEVPEALAPYTPHHRFRVANNQWPLVQIGPGILTVNDTENYVWDSSFYPRCAALIDTLFNIYPDSNERLRIFEVTLRYVDADEMLGGSAMEFLEELKVAVKLSDTLFAGGRINNTSLGVGLSLTYPTIQPKGAFQISFNQGRKNDQYAMIWETKVLSRGSDAPKQPEAIKDWLKNAHETTHDWFFRQIDGDLLEKYR